VTGDEYDAFLECILEECARALRVGETEFDELARRRWASVLEVFGDQCRAGARPNTPRSCLGSPKPKKRRYTGGLYKKFAVSVGLKKKTPTAVAFDLATSDSVASPGQGPAPRQALVRGDGETRLGSAATNIKNGPVPAVQPRSKRKVLSRERRERGFERFFEMSFWVFASGLAWYVLKYPEETAQRTRRALHAGRGHFLACLGAGFALRPKAFARLGFWVAALIAVRTIAGFGYGIEAARDPWPAVAPYVCFARAACENRLTEWLRLVVHGK
jgi:hypothetical protein